MNLSFVWCEELSRSRRPPRPLIFSSIGIILHIIISLIQLLILGLEQKILNFREKIWKDNQRERNNWDILIAIFYFVLIIYLFLLFFFFLQHSAFLLERNLRMLLLKIATVLLPPIMQLCLIVNFKNVLKD